MEKRNLLEIVNDVAASLDYEEVSDIGDTPESEQIVRIARSAFNQLSVDSDWSHQRVLSALTALDDPDHPNALAIPDNIIEVYEIKYDKREFGETRKNFEHVPFYVYPQDFLDCVLDRDDTDDDITLYDTPGDNSISLPIRTDRAPEFCTTFDDKYVVFDSFDSEVDSTLQQSKNMVIGLSSASWQNTNTFVPDMPARMFPVFLAKVRVLANQYLRQVTSREDLHDLRSGINRLRRKQRLTQQHRRPNYGRKARR